MTKRNANSLDELIENFRDIFKSDKVEIDEVKELMSKFKSKSYEWRDYAHFDQVKYTRNLIDTGYGKYNLILICWSPGQGTRIHDHSNSHCFMKILTGSLKETRFEWPEKMNTTNDPDDIHEMVKKGETTFKSEEVAYINDSIGLHRIENPSHVEPAVSLHLYAPPIKYCKTFDERTGKTDEIKCGFYSEYGKKIHPSAIPDIKTYQMDNLITHPLSQVKEREGFLTFRG